MQHKNRNALMQLLAQAQSAQQVIAAIPPALHPADLTEAYAIQNAMDEARGIAAAGYKVGMGSVAGMRKTGAGEPVIGRIASHRRHASGATISIPAGATAVIEVEAALEIAADGFSISRAFLAFEIVASRLAGGAAQGWPVFVADDAGCHAVVVGDSLNLEGSAPPAIELKMNGQSAGTMATGDDAIVPHKTFAQFIEIARRHAMPRNSGMLVMTGSLTVPVPVTQSAEFTASAGHAEVSAKLIFG